MDAAMAKSVALTPKSSAMDAIVIERAFSENTVMSWVQKPARQTPQERMAFAVLMPFIFFLLLFAMYHSLIKAAFASQGGRKPL